MGVGVGVVVSVVGGRLWVWDGCDLGMNVGVGMGVGLGVGMRAVGCVCGD